MLNWAYEPIGDTRKRCANAVNVTAQEYTVNQLGARIFQGRVL